MVTLLVIDRFDWSDGAKLAVAGGVGLLVSAVVVSYAYVRIWRD